MVATESYSMQKNTSLFKRSILRTNQELTPKRETILLATDIDNAPNNARNTRIDSCTAALSIALLYSWRDICHVVSNH